MRIKIYRLEYKNGKGPYQYHEHSHAFEEDPLYSMWNEHTTKAFHVPPRLDFEKPVYDGKRINQAFVFGCDTIETLHQWFQGWITKLFNFGFQLIEYELEIKDVIFGKSKNQVAFKKDNAIKKRILS